MGFYILNPIISNIIPDNTPITYNIVTIFMFCLIPLFVLNNTASPTPAPTNVPEIIVEIEITFSKYICVNITDDAQFGIKPINPDKIGPNIGLFCKKLEICSSPIAYITIFINIVTININTNMFNVCFKADFIIPCSQWQWSFSQKSTIFCSSSFLLVLITKSIKNPAIIPINNFIPSIDNIVVIGTASDINIGNISSDVDRYTAINVPSVITLAA